jgi:hypothetical protein
VIRSEFVLAEEVEGAARVEEGLDVGGLVEWDVDGVDDGLVGERGQGVGEGGAGVADGSVIAGGGVQQALGPTRTGPGVVVKDLAWRGSSGRLAQRGTSRHEAPSRAAAWMRQESQVPARWR